MKYVKTILKNLKIVLALILSLIGSFILINFIYPQTGPTPPKNISIKVILAQSPDMNLQLSQISVEKISSSNYQLNIDRDFYTIKMFDSKNNELFSGKILNKYTMMPPDYFRDTPQARSARKTTQTTIPERLALFLPYFKTAKKIVFSDESGIIKLQVDTDRLHLN